MAETEIRILLVDDHPVVRAGLAAMLETQGDFAVAGEAGDGNEAVRQIEALNPDVVLMDLEMPGTDGLEALEELAQKGLPNKVIVFTIFATDDRILRAVQAGAQGYLLKSAPREEVFQAIRIVYAGGSLLQPVVAARLLNQVSGKGGAPGGLTPREREVLELLAKGLQNKEIAAVLHIGERTAKFHVSSLMRKLGAGNRTEAVALAAQQGLITV
jgi:DNA-binding NarL/FixJ family response regulator